MEGSGLAGGERVSMGVKMIVYRMMDESCLLPACLHGGPIPLASLREAATTPTDVEKQEGIVAGTLARFLQALCRHYGSCAALAIHNGAVVGKLRFAPAQVELMVSGICLHDGYRGQGIAKQILETVIDWARATGWEALSSSAVRHIPPLLNWTGQASLKALQERGFTVVSGEINPDLREGVLSQRGGHHGDEVKQAWRAFRDVSDDEAAMLYELGLDLQGNDATEAEDSR
jgi:GNAT superfamily N-acetyltransferase